MSDTRAENLVRRTNTTRLGVAWSRLTRHADPAGSHVCPSRGPFVAAALAVVLSWPAVGTGWRLDDLHHRVALTSSPVRVRGYELDPGLTGLFVFFGGDRAHTERLRRAGVSP